MVWWRHARTIKYLTMLLEKVLIAVLIVQIASIYVLIKDFKY